MRYPQQAGERKEQHLQKLMMVKRIKNKHTIYVLIILLCVISVELLHLPFYGDLRKNIFFFNLRFLHIGFVPSVVLLLLVKKRSAKMLACTLLVYQFMQLIMELAAFNGHKKLVTEINSYFYAELLMICLSLVLCVIGSIIINNGVHCSLLDKFFNLCKILQRNF